jgi:hypothetical protein
MEKQSFWSDWSSLSFPPIDICPDSDNLYLGVSDVPGETIFGGDDMERNVGSIDGNIRIVLGIIFLGIGLFSQLGAGLKIGAFAVGAIAIATSFFRFCPLWKMLGISTHKEEKAEGTERPVERTAGQEEKTKEGEGKPSGH